MDSIQNWGCDSLGPEATDGKIGVGKSGGNKRQPKSKAASATHHETSDTYHGVVAQLCECHRVVVCNYAIQWILQRRKKGGAERPWRGVGYFLRRDALIRASTTLCGRIDPAAMAILLALPASIRGAS